jgi:hypothetical protein
MGGHGFQPCRKWNFSSNGTAGSRALPLCCKFELAYKQVILYD